MKVIRREERGAEILGLVGRLTAGNGVETLRDLEAALFDGPDRVLVLDLSRVDYIDAAGVGELLRLRRKAMTCGKNLLLSGITEHVQDVLGVARLAGELDVAADIDEALERISTEVDRDPKPQPSPLPARSVRARESASHAYHIPVIVAL